MGAGLLLRPKALYLALNACVYATCTIMVNFAKHRWGVPDHVAGYMVALSAVGFPGSLLWTSLADRTGRVRDILVGTTMCYAACTLMIYALAVPLEFYSESVRRAVLGALSLLASFFSAGLYPLVDRSVMALLAREPNVSLESYSRQRLFGIFGQAAVTAGIGGFVGAYGYGAAFAFFACATAVFLLLVLTTVPRLLTSDVPVGMETGKCKRRSTETRRKRSNSVCKADSLKSETFGDSKVVSEPNVVATIDGNEGNSKHPSFTTGADLGQSKLSAESGLQNAETVPNQSHIPNCLPPDEPMTGDTKCSEGSQKSLDSSNKHVRRHLRQLRALRNLPAAFHAFLGAVLVAGVVRGVLGNFLVLYCEAVFNMSLAVACLVQVGRVVPEVAMFFVSAPMIRSWGAPAVFQLGALAGVLRAACYAALAFLGVAGNRGAVAAFLLEALKGVSNACVVAAGVRIAHDSAPSGLEASAQGAFSGVHAYLAHALSGVFGGALLHVQDGERAIAYAWMLAATAGLGVFGVLLYLPFVRRSTA